MRRLLRLVESAIRADDTRAIQYLERVRAELQIDQEESDVPALRVINNEDN